MIGLQEAIERLEGLKSNFRYEDAPRYAELVREFYSAMKKELTVRGRPLYTPLTDITWNAELELPPEVEHRLALLLCNCNDYGRTVGNVCRWYLREVCARELGLIQREFSLYEPLIRILEMGGHFYEHHGALGLSDAAMIPFIGR